MDFKKTKKAQSHELQGIEHSTRIKLDKQTLVFCRGLYVRNEQHRQL